MMTFYLSEPKNPLFLRKTFKKTAARTLFLKTRRFKVKYQYSSELLTRFYLA